MGTNSVMRSMRKVMGVLRKTQHQAEGGGRGPPQARRLHVQCWGLPRRSGRWGTAPEKLLSARVAGDGPREAAFGQREGSAWAGRRREGLRPRWRVLAAQPLCASAPHPPALARGAACLSLSQTRLVSSPRQKTLKASFIIALSQRGKMKRLKTMK